MAYILHLDTTTKKCSVALAFKGSLCAQKERAGAASASKVPAHRGPGRPRHAPESRRKRPDDAEPGPRRRALQRPGSAGGQREGTG